MVSVIIKQIRVCAQRAIVVLTFGTKRMIVMVSLGFRVHRKATVY